ncbi:DUF2182 domain-containing protein [Paraburkholderia xenovorans]|uniref:DUF2182 domain-containing protein n=1 Tax=Paraburkholderia xenovorans TaxID=36873 RepID=UPI0038BE0876
MSGVSAIGERMASRRGASQRSFVGVSGLLFVTGVAATVLCCTSMSTMSGMPMPGGWTMSMAWLRMCGQTWRDVAASFVGMWVVMTVAMMLPSLMPMLWRYRKAVSAAGESRVAWLTVIVGAGYFAVWTAFGVLAFPLGAALASMEMRMAALAREVPFAVGVVVVVCGVLQFTAWKARRLACCRASPMCGDHMLPTSAAAWRHGVQLGLHCCYCCAGLTTILLVTGVMDLRIMGAVTAAITAERLLPHGERVARAIGGIAIAAAMLMLVRAL